ncbi:putative pectate lyase 18 precursor [Prunus yedoensis var. nudiflora]|uniref:Putative pectate lyase 18 n=1 Tax=Prunus yedoensis var. nudiflora TaxID=2094558 RepID=A0A314ZP54_PRUYE|nr:putative pectate lyase 18 precursor [Prunus yedoensis var. nudiflora]
MARPSSGPSPLSLLIFLLFSLLTPTLIASRPLQQNPELVVQDVTRSINDSVSRRNLGYLSCGTGNPIDDCWRCDPNWEQNRQRLADCAIGFGKNAIGGRDGKIYVVTDSGDDDPVTPKPGTLRHAVIQDEPLWIIFQRDMTIQLKEELIMNSFKTIDGRGASVHIAGGPCITVQFVTNIIIHGLHIHDCKQGGNAWCGPPRGTTGGGLYPTATACPSSVGATCGWTIALCQIAKMGWLMQFMGPLP